MIEFSKYKQKGDYHHREYADVNNKYHKHANRVREWVKEKNVLDVGAGDGLITMLLGAKGIEYEEEGVRLAKEHGVDVIQGDAYSLPFGDNSFEAVTMIDVLEHFEFPEKALSEALRVAPVLYINTPPKKDDGTLTDKYHIQEWSPSGLVKFVESNGYVLDGCVTVYPKEKLMYARFTRI
jgi:ubiquinone/menaquinone biosynthesis C-methylase UbiE